MFVIQDDEYYVVKITWEENATSNHAIRVGQVKVVHLQYSLYEHTKK